MRPLQRMAALLALILLFASGFLLVLLTVRHEFWTFVPELIVASRWPVFLAGLLLMMAGLLFAVSGFSGRNRERFLSFEQEGGAISISTRAIAEYLSKVAPEFPAVVQMRPSVVPRRGSVDILVLIRIRAGPQVSEVCQLLKQRVRDSLTNGLGISHVGSVEIRVGEIVSEHRPL